MTEGSGTARRTRLPLAEALAAQLLERVRWFSRGRVLRFDDLYALAPGWTRAQTESAIDCLVASGRLAEGPRGELEIAA